MGACVRVCIYTEQYNRIPIQMDEERRRNGKNVRQEVVFDVHALKSRGGNRPLYALPVDASWSQLFSGARRSRIESNGLDYDTLREDDNCNSVSQLLIDKLLGAEIGIYIFPQMDIFRRD